VHKAVKITATWLIFPVEISARGVSLTRVSSCLFSVWCRLSSLPTNSYHLPADCSVFWYSSFRLGFFTLHPLHPSRRFTAQWCNRAIAESMQELTVVSPVERDVITSATECGCWQVWVRSERQDKCFKNSTTSKNYAEQNCHVKSKKARI